MNLFKRLFHKHTWVMHSWSYVKCSECGKTAFNEKLAKKLCSATFNRLYSGTVHHNEAQTLLSKRGIKL